MSTKNNRAQRRAGKIPEAAKKRLSKALYNEAKCADAMIRRYYHGASRPEDYLRRSIAWRAIQCLPTIIDNYLYDIETVGGIPPRDPKFVKLLKDARTAVDRFMQYAYRDNVDSFEQIGCSHSEAMESANCAAEVANEICKLIEFVVVWCSEEENGAWRLSELQRIVNNLAPESVKREQVKACQQYCANWLKERHINVDEAIANGIEAKDLCLTAKEDLVKSMLEAHGFHSDEETYKNAATSLINKK